MEAPVEIRYAGVVIGRAQDVRAADGDASFFLAVRESMPVGSVLHLRSGDRETPARVVHTVESQDPAACGMQVRLIGEAEERTTEWIPPPAPATEKAHSGEQLKTAMPVIEVEAGFSLAETEVPAQAAPEAAKAPAEQIELSFAPETPAAAEAAAGAANGREASQESPQQSSQESSERTAPDATQAPAPAQAVPQEIPAAARTSTSSYGTVRDPQLAPADSSAGTDAAPATGEAQPSGEDLPPARPIAGPSGRRKTKRRR